MAYRVNGFSNQILAFPEPLFKVFHDTTLQGDGTPTSPLRAIGGGGGGSSTWGSISGTLSNQTDLQSALNSKFTLPSLTSGSVLFSDGSTIAQDNPNFFWDNTNNRLGIGTATPSAFLEVVQTSGTAGITLSSVSRNDFVLKESGSVILRFLTSSTTPYVDYANNLSFRYGTGAGSALVLTSAGLASFAPATVASTSGTVNGLNQTSTFAAAAGSANYRAVNINYTINNSGAQTGNATGIFLNATETALNGMSHNLMDLQYGGATKFSIRRDGYLYSVGGISNQSAYTGAGNSAASSPIYTLTGTWFTGGTTTTTKPHFLIEPTGATSTAWAANGTALGINSATGFAGNLIDTQVNGTTRFSVDSTGDIYQNSVDDSGAIFFKTSGVLRFHIMNAGALLEFKGSGAANFGMNFETTATNADGRNSGSTFRFAQNFAPTSGSIDNTTLLVMPTINQTGGANGVTRGIFINPTLTSASNFRSLSFATPSGTEHWFRPSGHSLILGNSAIGNIMVIDNSNVVTWQQYHVNATSSAASNPAHAFTGTWTTGGTSTTNKPHVLIQPSGTTSTNWNTNGTGIGINAATGFTGNFLDLQLNAANILSVYQTGGNTTKIDAGSSRLLLNTNTGVLQFNDGNSTLAWTSTGLDANTKRYSGGNLLLTKNQVLSEPNIYSSGTWITGGTGTTNKPYVLIEPSGATSTNWSTSGTGLGVNAPSGFVGNVADFQINGTSIMAVTSGNVVLSTGARLITNSIRTSGILDLYQPITVSATNNGGFHQNALSLGGSATFPVAMMSQFTVNQSGTAGYTGLLLDITETAVGSGTKNFFEARVGGVTKYSVSNVGTVTAVELRVNGGSLYFKDGSGFYSRIYGAGVGDGVIKMTNDGNNDFNRLQFGGTTSSFPAIKKSTTGLAVRLADDSADSFISASTFISTSTVRLKGYTVATLPASPTTGDVCYCTDLTSPTYMGTAVGGGSVTGKVFYNGTNWIT